MFVVSKEKWIKVLVTWSYYLKLYMWIKKLYAFIYLIPIRATGVQAIYNNYTFCKYIYIDENWNFLYICTMYVYLIILRK